MTEPPVPPPSPSARPPRPGVDTIQFRPEANQYIQSASTNYGALLKELARILAVRGQADEVQTIHAEKATHILSDSGAKSIRREVLILFGGGLFGAFLQGFTDAVITSPVSPLKVVTYVAFGLLGLALALWGLLRR